MYYFAYGCNMNHVEMLAKHCPGAQFIGPGKLEGYWFVFDGYSVEYKGAIENIVRSKEDEVWGGVFEITEAHLEALDREKGYPRYYSRELMDVELPGTKEKVKAWAYSHEPLASGLPSRSYLKTLVQGAHDCHIPENYIDINIDVHPLANCRFY